MRRFCSFALVAAGMVCLAFAGTTRAQEKPHPRIHHALYELRESKNELKKAAHNFGGHRKAALASVDKAIGQIQKALKFSGDKRPFKGDPKAEYYKTYPNHPHIRHAVTVLKDTITELNAASHNYGGHRKAAVDASQDAINKLGKALEYANSKKKKK
jgi:hypothetical protein